MPGLLMNNANLAAEQIVTCTQAQFNKKWKEQRITFRLIKYWEDLRCGRPMPMLSEVKTRDIEDVIDDCFMIRLLDNNERQYAYIGSNLHNLQVMMLKNDPPQKYEALLQQAIEDVITKRRPLLMDKIDQCQNSGHAVRYSLCLLPFGGNLGVNGILGGVRFKLFPPELQNATVHKLH